MSRGLERSEAALERKAQNRAAIVRRVVREYNESVQNDRAVRKAKKEREIDRVVAELMETHKALKRLRKKMRARK